ncbi:hypothetical protein AOZ06_38470 [Kibdelosporangium phytohabitans]|uniref:Uncharacterized protein n=1 Tax=Kibdelosporangium phytohabitans TaxID=860235 RepID=A0A0N7F4P1_9PSEU|nr:hypothetical protein AOZ06_38470 [Kibdelosporangium phytohabitans]
MIALHAGTGKTCSEGLLDRFPHAISLVSAMDHTPGRGQSAKPGPGGSRCGPGPAPTTKPSTTG